MSKSTRSRAAATAKSGSSAAKADTQALITAEKRNALAGEILTMPSAQNGRVLQAWGRLGEIELGPVVDKLREASRAVVAGEMKQVEAMLFDQAVALQAIFTNLSIEASRAEYLGKLDPLLRLALKAQSQSRATLETLAAIKNPPVVYARQANIANGPQQVNNGLPGPPPPPAALAQSLPTELFEEAQHGNRMDAGAACAASGADSHLATLGAVDGTQDGAGEGPEQEQPVSRRRAAALSQADAVVARGDGRAARSARPAVAAGTRTSRKR